MKTAAEEKGWGKRGGSCRNSCLQGWKTQTLTRQPGLQELGTKMHTLVSPDPGDSAVCPGVVLMPFLFCPCRRKELVTPRGETVGLLSFRCVLFLLSANGTVYVAGRISKTHTEHMAAHGGSDTAETGAVPIPVPTIAISDKAAPEVTVRSISAVVPLFSFSLSFVCCGGGGVIVPLN